MKSMMTISIDSDVLKEARTKIDNLSKTMEELLKKELKRRGDKREKEGKIEQNMSKLSKGKKTL